MFVRDLAGAGEPVRVTHATERDVAGYVWAGDVAVYGGPDAPVTPDAPPDLDAPAEDAASAPDAATEDAATSDDAGGFDAGLDAGGSVLLYGGPPGA